MKISRANILFVMAKKKMSVSDIANRSGRSKQRISCILNSCNVTPKTVGMLAEALECDIAEIIDD